jgi:hypothetical protein
LEYRFNKYNFERTKTATYKNGNVQKRQRTKTATYKNGNVQKRQRTKITHSHSSDLTDEKESVSTLNSLSTSSF